MTTIYAVSTGEYSDYRVVALFTTEELAQKFIDSFVNNTYTEFNKIEEYILNPHIKDLAAGRKPYELRMNINGEIQNIEHSDTAFGFDGLAQVSFTYDKQWMNFRGFAKDENHAIKIANEKRVQIIAMNKWGEIN